MFSCSKPTGDYERLFPPWNCDFLFHVSGYFLAILRKKSEFLQFQILYHTIEICVYISQFFILLHLTVSCFHNRMKIKCDFLAHISDIFSHICKLIFHNAYFFLRIANLKLTFLSLYLTIMTSCFLGIGKIVLRTIHTAQTNGNKHQQTSFHDDAHISLKGCFAHGLFHFIRHLFRRRMTYEDINNSTILIVVTGSSVSFPIRLTPSRREWCDATRQNTREVLLIISSDAVYTGCGTVWQLSHPV